MLSITHSGFTMWILFRRFFVKNIWVSDAFKPWDVTTCVQREAANWICPPASTTSLFISMSVVQLRYPFIYTRTFDKTLRSSVEFLQPLCRISFFSRSIDDRRRSGRSSATWWPVEVEMTRSERLPISECVIGLDGSPNVASSLLFIVDTEDLVESSLPRSLARRKDDDTMISFSCNNPGELTFPWEWNRTNLQQVSQNSHYLVSCTADSEGFSGLS